MLKTLHVFDLMPFIHAGHVNRYSNLERLVDMGVTWKTQVTPTGGCSLVFNSLYTAMQEGDVIICSDRTPTIKQDMIPGYKGNRSHKNDILIERLAAEYILQKCNITLYARAGYEADDLIYTIVKHYHDQYDKIYIYTGDSDLYFLVDEVVSIRPSSSRAKAVDINNYEKVVHKDGMRYNCMTTSKIIGGDSSDCIPPMSKEDQYKYAEAMYKPEFYPHLGNKDFVRYWTSMLCPWALPRVDMVFPLDVDDIDFEIKTPDKQMVINFGDAINNKNFRGRADVDFDVTPYIIEMQEQGIYLEEEV